MSEITQVHFKFTDGSQETLSKQDLEGNEKCTWNTFFKGIESPNSDEYYYVKDDEYVYKAILTYLKTKLLNIDNVSAYKIIDIYDKMTEIKLSVPDTLIYEVEKIQKKKLFKALNHGMCRIRTLRSYVEHNGSEEERRMHELFSINIKTPLSNSCLYQIKEYLEYLPFCKIESLTIQDKKWITKKYIDFIFDFRMFQYLGLLQHISVQDDSGKSITLFIEAKEQSPRFLQPDDVKDLSISIELHNIIDNDIIYYLKSYQFKNPCCSLTFIDCSTLWITTYLSQFYSERTESYLKSLSIIFNTDNDSISSYNSLMKILNTLFIPSLTKLKLKGLPKEWYSNDFPVFYSFNSFPSLETIDLSDNDYTSTLSLLISEALSKRSSSSITTLIFKNNHISLVPATNSSYSSSTSLSSRNFFMNLSNICFSNLIYLDISYNLLSKDDFESLTLFFSTNNCQHFKYLYLNKIGMNEDYSSLLYTIISTTYTTLETLWNPIGSEGLHSLCQAISHFPPLYLSTLNLNGCSINGPNIHDFLVLFEKRYLQSLTHLSLGYNGLQNSFVLSLFSILLSKPFHKLIYLDLSYNELNDTFVNEFITICKNIQIQSLQYFYCNGNPISTSQYSILRQMILNKILPNIKEALF
ncbi:hypothetical protein WA158_003816 [Blastocystis sp. Blastoise]